MFRLITKPAQPILSVAAKCCHGTVIRKERDIGRLGRTIAATVFARPQSSAVGTHEVLVEQNRKSSDLTDLYRVSIQHDGCCGANRLLRVGHGFPG